MNYGKESAWAAGPVPVVVDEIPPQKSSRGFWRKKRTWMTLVVVVVFGVVFGAVYGTKRTSESQTQQELDAAAGDGSASYPKTTNSQPTPTPSSLNPAGPLPSGAILKRVGVVPQDIGAAREDDGLLLWSLQDEGVLWRSNDPGVWTMYSDRRFLVAPISVTTSDSTQTAVSVDAISGRIVYMHFQDGQWGSWEELEFDAQFLRRPSVVSRAQGRVDVVNVDSNGGVWIVSYDGSAWSTWTKLGDGITTGVVATSSDENRIDVFGRNGSGVWQKYWTNDSGWGSGWMELGAPDVESFDEDLSSPLAVSWHEHEDGNVIEVVVQVRSMYHKMLRNDFWSEWMVIPASHEGGEFVDTQSIARGSGMDGHPFAHMVSRGTNNCINFITFNGTDWDSWDYLWCMGEEYRSAGVPWPTEFMPTFALGGAEGVVDLVMRDMEGDIRRMPVSALIYQGESWSEGNWGDFGKPA